MLSLKERQKQFVIDGGSIVRGLGRYSNFNALLSCEYKAEVEMLVFDTLALDGADLRDLPLQCAKRTSRGFLPDGRRASSSQIISKGKSARTYSARRASSSSKAWYRSGPAPLRW